MKLRKRIINFLLSRNYKLYKYYIENSPAEVSVIDFSDNNKHSIKYVNQIKAKEFGIVKTKDVLCEKCHNIFEPERNGACIDCPSQEAFTSKKTIHKDWEYKHPIKKEIRYSSITSNRIGDTNLVIEVCRDSTIRKVITDLILELSSIKDIKELSYVISDKIIGNLYFNRVRFYIYHEDEKLFKLNSFYESMRVDEYTQEAVPYKTNNDITLLEDDTIPDKFIIENKQNPKPIIYIIKDKYGDIPEEIGTKFYYKIISKDNDYINYPDILNKKDYPVWIDLPLVSKGKIYGKLSIDKKDIDVNNFIDDYEYKFFELLSQSISNTLENLDLINQTSLHDITEIILSKSFDNEIDIFNGIVTSGSNFLNSKNVGFLSLISNEIIYLEKNKSDDPQRYNPPFNLTELIPIIKRLKKKVIRGIIYKDQISGCFSNDRNILNIIILPIGNLKKIQGVFFIYDVNIQKYNQQFAKNLKLLSNQIKLAMSMLSQFKENIESRQLAVNKAEEAKKHLALRNEFFDAANHELIAPLGPIYHCLLYLEKKYHGVNDRVTNNMILNSVFNCQFLINSFTNIDFLKPDKEIKLNLSLSLMFKDIIIPMVETCRHYALSNNKKIKYEGYENIEKEIYLDLDKMRHVFFNLINNAIRYSHDNTLIIVRGVKVKNDISYIDVISEGIGIPEEDNEKIFEKYYRSNNAKRVNVQGTGIGLFIVHEIITAHKGKIYLHKNDKETVFRMELPKNNEL